MNDHHKKHIAVLGGGVAGIITAAQLSANNTIAVTLFEKEHCLGGLHKSVEIDGCHYDVGTFTFNSEHEYFRTFPGLEDLFIWFPHDNTSLTPAHTLDCYPLSFKGYIRDNGVLTTFLDTANIFYSKLRYKKRDTLTSYLHYYVGSGFYHRSGLKNYIERLYCTSDKNIDLEFAKKRLQMIEEKCSLRANFKTLLKDLRTSNENHRWHCRLRPPTGFKTAYSYIENQLHSRGVDVRLNAGIQKVFKSDSGKFIIEENGRAGEFDRVISTIPMEIMAQYLGLSLVYQPRYMKLVSLFYRFKGDLGYDTSCLYNFSLGGKWKRITTFSQYYGKHDGHDYFTLECTQPHDEPHSVDELHQDFKNHINGLSLLKGELELVGSYVTDRAYPMYGAGDMGKIAAAKKQLAEAGIDFAGRQGNFDYSNSLDIARKSKAAAQALDS